MNHNSKLSLAMKLILGQKAGANAVKFQTFKAKNLLFRYFKVPYQNNRFDKEIVT